MKCGMICLSPAAQLPVLQIGENTAQNFMNQATFHSTFPIFGFNKYFKCYAYIKLEVLSVQRTNSLVDTH